MTSENDLLFPAFQKFYSALSNLERFRKGGNFFDNISCLDTFFTEFKGIIENTEFVLQNTPYKDLFKEKKAEIYAKFGWFYKTRDGVIHRSPFPLKKQVDITIYFPGGCINVLEKTFTIANDEAFSSMLDQLHSFFFEVDPVEVLFSVKFSFHQGNSQEDLFEKVLNGTHEMWRFLTKLKEEIPCQSPACDELCSRIRKSYILHVSKDLLLIDDFVYYPSKREFADTRRGCNTLDGSGKTLSRVPLSFWENGPIGKLGNSNFERFVLLHALQQNTELMPAFMIIYGDGTYDIDAFFSNNKTTSYRKINEIAEKILNEPVQEVYYEQVFLSIPPYEGIELSTAAERATHAAEEWLVFMKVDSHLGEDEYAFYGPGLKCFGYIAQQMKTGHRHKLIFGTDDMRPIIEAFKKKMDNNQSEAGELLS